MINNKLLTGAAGAGGLVPSENFNTVIYTGTGGTQNITSVGFAPDFVWIKQRTDSSTQNLLQDTVRGIGSSGGAKILYSDSTEVESTNADSTYFASFNSNGFTIGSNSVYNNSGKDYVSWCWKAGGAAVTNNTGTQSTQVSANVGAGFSIVSLTHPSINVFTYGHSLSAVPEIIILKRTDAVDDWYVYTAETGNTARMQLNDDAAVFNSTGVWGSTTPTDEVFTIYNQTAGDYIAYCWRSIPGYSKIGFYVGTETTQNIYMGFKPAWIMLKSTTSGAGNSYWTVFDNKRNPSNPRTCEIYPNSADTEYCTVGSSPNYRGLNFTDTGIELLSTSYNNEAFETFIYMAFSE